MGRTKRIRTKNKSRERELSLDCTTDVIELKKWMCKHDWKNSTQLQLFDFKYTGRGVCSKMHMMEHEPLIEIPYDLMISFSVIGSSDIKQFIKKPLKIHELLAIFLVYERHRNSLSKWNHYINSLPSENPSLAWLCSDEELQKLPEEYRAEVEKRKWCLEASWERIKESINFAGQCPDCKENLDCVFTANSFIWGYVMVNTRAVYVDPDIISSQSDNSDIVSDSPSMALCPYLDMFNHSSEANSIAELVWKDNKLIYKLTTLKRFRKFEQIFISYGSHNNIKLLCEYGFFTPNNKFDFISIQFIEVINYLRKMRVQLNEKQYKYIKGKGLDNNMNVSLNGLSFNLKGILFVALHGDLKDWGQNIYSENYSKEDLIAMFLFAKTIVENLTCFCFKEKCNVYLSSFIDYLNYKKTYLENTLEYLNYEIEKLRNNLN